jgi:hydrogenase nickel incorporation protein HypB
VQPRIVEVRQNILKQNDLRARALRRRFADAGVVVVNLVSGPGAGKTALLEATLREMRERYAVAALTGDLATDNDARRLARSGAPVRQISTGTVCHLEAQMIDDALGDWDLNALDYLFIENVGNLVCPASYDLGEQLRAVLLCVTEGEDKPLKYPTIFNSADLALITKCDLADAVGFDRTAAYENINDVRPGLPILETSSRSPAGIAEWIARLEACRRASVAPVAALDS